MKRNERGEWSGVLVEFFKRMVMVIVIAMVSFVLVGCDVTADDPHGLVEKDLKLSDGRTVICVQNDRGNSLSCDWGHAVK